MSAKKSSSSAVPTRGIRKLQQYLGSDEKELIKPKTAKDLVPTLAGSNTHHPVSLPTAGPTQRIHADVLQHMEACLSCGAARKLSGKQFKAVQLLGQRHDRGDTGSSGNSPTDTYDHNNHTQKIAVKRVVLPEEDMWHTIAVGALQRAAATATSPPTEPAGSNAVKDHGAPEENRSVFVLTSSEASARELADWLTSHYHLNVVLAADKSAPSFPVLPADMQRGRGKSSSARGRSRSPPPRTASSTAASPEWAAPVVVSSPEGFLATDQRSAIWRCIGVFVVAASGSGSGASSSKAVLPTGISPATLSKHRWNCLGHTPLTIVLAPSEQAATAPVLDWLTTVKPVQGAAEDKTTLGTAALSKRGPARRREIQVHYHALEGMQRIQCLYGLLHGLQQGRGMVVRLATREMCTFLFDALYRFLDALPPYIRLLSDYDGNSEYASTKTSEDRLRLSREFDEMVDTGRTAPVLLTCFGLVPTKGSIFLQYDLIDDLPNFSNFLAEKVTPGASACGSSSSSTECGSAAPALEVVERTVSRKRSRSPRPMQRGGGGGNSPVKATSSQSGAEDEASSSSAFSAAAAAASAAATCYSHILVLFRPCEVKPALEHLRRTGARHSLVYTPLAKPPPLTRFLFVAEKIRSMHRKLFAIQNAAYHAYKATMTVYCTLGPRDVYNEANLDLVKVAQEFGYEEVPLLDLRLKDTPFRPKEDYVKASRVKMAKARREHKAFAEEHIHGEGPAPLAE